MAWNQIDNPNVVRVGDRLTIRNAQARWMYYEVQPGDTLGHIAIANSCTLADLKMWNDLDGAAIFPGQKLKIQQ